MPNFTDIIRIKEENCTNCHQCITVCPIQICNNGIGDVVIFDSNLCIGCGRCVDECIKSHGGVIENSARFFIDDSPQFLNNLPHKEMVALIAPSAASNFKLNKLITALKQLNIKHVYDVSLGAEITVALYHQTIENKAVKLPLISSPCPVIVKYIQLIYPELIGYLAPFGSPVHNLAVYVNSLHPEAELVFFSPCLEKTREIRNQTLIKYNVLYQSLHNILEAKGIDLDILPDGDFDNSVPAGIATNFSTPGGLKESYLHHYPSTPASSIARVEGSMVFDSYLPNLQESIKQEASQLPLIVDILSCENGCNSGLGCINKSIKEMEYVVAARSERSISDKTVNKKLDSFLVSVINTHNFKIPDYKDLSYLYHPKLPNESELQDIYINMLKFEEKDFRNCAACGYGSCYYMAVAIYNGLNKIQNCHLYQEKALRRDQQALQVMHMELSTVFNAMSDGLIVLDKEGRVSQFNSAAQEITGYTNEAFIGVHVIDLFSGKAPYTMKLLESGEPFKDREILIDGVRGKMHGTASGEPRVDENNNVTGATIVLRPIARVQDLVNTISGAQASFTFDSIIGNDPYLKDCIRLAKIASNNNSNVLLQAASGSGKEVFAQAIHNGSSRRNGPFVAINCAAIPRELVGSELFGYVDGAFTGAKRGGRPGKFELASKGTLFLDEIGDMPLEHQVVLLRAIQEKAIFRVGGDSPIKVDVRIIAASNQDLLELIKLGRFRDDLYYRLNVVNISIPALRERREDIKLLFEYFIKEMSPRFNKHFTGIDEEVIKYLKAYDWPGNIRELQNVVERTLLIAEGSYITVDCLPREVIGSTDINARYSFTGDYRDFDALSQSMSNRSTRKLQMGELEKENIVRTLNLHGGNVSRTAAELGMSRNTLYRKMKQYAINN
ncbi:MAG: sigma 54-interacting transcriptional regulator [Syntrophomonas sp.]|nr:sigma 54-interacting transcriptional regulator [Syntrophomonas sp.]